MRGGETAKICAVCQKRRDALVKGLARAGWAVEPPRGTMFVWAAIPGKRGQATLSTGGQRSLSPLSLEFSKLLLEKALV